MEWGNWSAYIISVGEPDLDLDAPGNFEVSRAFDNTEVVLGWTAPSGNYDGFAVQRQVLVIVEGSTIFANTTTLADDLSASTLTYTDGSIAPGRTYEYRVAATQDGIVGDYTEWSRATPFDSSLGVAPGNFRVAADDRARTLADRREFRMRWDEVAGADDYEVDVLDHGTGGMETRIVSDPSYFVTAYGRVSLRVRGHRSDDALCGDGDGSLETGEDCYTDWTGWDALGFVPRVTQPGVATPVPAASIDDFRGDVNELLDSTLDQSGVDVDPGIAIQFAVLVGTVMVASVSVWAGWRKGMRPLGVGMAFSVVVISLYLGYVLLGIPAAWPIGAQSLIAIPGLIAFARQLGAFR